MDLCNIGSGVSPVGIKSTSLPVSSWHPKVSPSNDQNHQHQGGSPDHSADHRDLSFAWQLIDRYYGHTNVYLWWGRRFVCLPCVHPSLQFHIHHARKHKGKPIHGYQTQSHVPKGKQGTPTSILWQKKGSALLCSHWSGYEAVYPLCTNIYQPFHQRQHQVFCQGLVLCVKMNLHLISMH